MRRRSRRSRASGVRRSGRCGTPRPPSSFLASFLTFSSSSSRPVSLPRFPTLTVSLRLHPSWQAAQLQKQIGGKEPTLIRLREEITHIEKKKAVEAKALKKAEEKRERAEEASAKLDTELSNIAETIDRLQSKHAGSQEDLAMGKEKRSEYKRLKTLAGANTAAFKERLQAARRELNTEEHLLAQLQNKANEV